MKICHVNLARGFSGGENQTLLLIKEQLRKQFELVVVAKQGSPFAEACRALDLELKEVGSYFSGHTRKLTENCNAVHVHEGQAVYWAFIQNLLFKAPYIITRRIDNPFKDKWLSNLAYSKASSIVCVSKAVERIVQGQFQDATTEIIHDSPVAYPVNQDVLSSLQSKYQGKYLVIHAAKLYQHKGFDITIGAARQLCKHRDIQFCLLGDGPELQNLKDLSKGLKNVEFLGHQTEMGAWFELADIVVLPSHTEGMGSVLLEATLAGTPVIGTRAGGIPDAVSHETNGLLVDTGDAEALADAILRLKTDHALQEQIKAKSPAFIADFSITQAAHRYHHVYKNL